MLTEPKNVDQMLTFWLVKINALIITYKITMPIKIWLSPCLIRNYKAMQRFDPIMK